MNGWLFCGLSTSIFAMFIWSMALLPTDFFLVAICVPAFIFYAYLSVIAAHLINVKWFDE